MTGALIEAAEGLRCTDSWRSTAKGNKLIEIIALTYCSTAKSASTGPAISRVVVTSLQAAVMAAALMFRVEH